MCCVYKDKGRLTIRQTLAKTTDVVFVDRTNNFDCLRSLKDNGVVEGG